MIGQVLGPYQVLSKLGEGGMGQVFRARDTRLDRDVAIKILPEAVAHDADRLARFRREAKTLASLNHPNIAGIHGLEESAGVFALVMELIEGEDLSLRIARVGIPIDEALPIAKQIADALEAAHDQGIVHRDLKPANVKIRAGRTVKVIDFGLAKFSEPESAATALTQSPTMMVSSPGVVLGTAAYMSPEQARGKPVDARTDIWAFGCVVYEMLTGRPAFSGETITDILGSIVKSDPNWNALPRETPPAIRRLLKRCFAKDPGERLHAIADARLEIVEAGRELTSGSPVLAALSKPNPIPWAIALVGLAAAAAMAVPAVRYFRATPPTPSEPPPTLRLEVSTPPTFDPISMAISPDGRRLTFVSSDNGTPRLWLRPLDSATAQPLPGTEGAVYPFWSPDSRTIGFGAGGKLKRIDIGGGQPQELTDTPGYRGGAWSREGVIVFATSSAGLRRVAASGGEVSAATKLDLREVNHRFPQFLPDGRHFIFFSQGGSIETNGMNLGSLDSTESKRLTQADAVAGFLPPDYVVYSRQGSLVARRIDLTAGALVGDAVTVTDRVGSDGAVGAGAFSVSVTGVVAYRTTGLGRRQLVWFDRTGRRTGVVGSPDANSPQYPELSRDGQRVAVDRTELNNRDVYQIDLARGEPTRFTFDSNIDATPIWSPEGSRIAFRTSRKGVYDLYRKSANLEGTETLLFESADAKAPNSWSPDGHHILFMNLGRDTQNDLWILPVGESASESKPWPIVQTPADEMQGVFSPDGKWIAYQSNADGPFQIYVQPFPGPGGKRQISQTGGTSPRWRRDGQELYFISPDGKLMAAPIRALGSTLESGTPVALFQPQLGTNGLAGNIRPQYDVAPDGRFLMNVMTEEIISPITLILNWRPPQ